MKALHSEVRWKTFCEKKDKFGLNCQAAANVHSIYLDISIAHGGTLSNFLVFEARYSYTCLENGLMKDGYILFGDNVYINTTVNKS